MHLCTEIWAEVELFGFVHKVTAGVVLSDERLSIKSNDDTNIHLHQTLSWDSYFIYLTEISSEYQ